MMNLCVKAVNSFRLPKALNLQRNSSTIYYLQTLKKTPIVLHKTVNNLIDNKNGVINSPSYCEIYKRYKSKQKKEESDSDTDEDDEESLREYMGSDKELNKISKVVQLNLASMRLDLVVKAGMNISRNKIEVAFYESKIRLNGNKVTKKSVNAHVEDEIDLIKGVCPDNSANIIVQRLEILDVKPRTDRIAVIVRKYKSLVIENNEAPSDTGLVK